MFKRWWIILVAALVIIPLFCPVLSIHTHMRMDAELAETFPEKLTGLQIILKGVNALPTNRLPALTVLDFRGWTLVLGVILAIAACGFCFVDRKGALHTALMLAVGAFLVFLYETFHLQNLSQTLIFQLLLNLDATLWISVVSSAVLIVSIMLLMRHGEGLGGSDCLWRKIGGVACLLSALCLFLPTAVTDVPENFIADDPVSAAAMRRSESGLSIMLSSEPSLSQLGKRDGLFTNVLSGGFETLVPLSADGENLRGVFLIGGGTRAFQGSLLCGVILLVLSAVLAFVPKVDRWFPLSLSALGVLVCAMQMSETLTLSDADLFSTATRQLCYLGVGHATLAPVFMTFLSLLGFGAQVSGVRRANSPYFVNPVPEGRRLRMVALMLGITSFIMMLIPSASFSFYKIGTVNIQCTASLSGVDSLTGHIPDTMLNPTNTRGKALYGEEAKEDRLNLTGFQSLMREQAQRFSVTTWVAMVFCAAGIVMLILQKSKTLCIGAFLISALSRVLTWILLSVGMPESVGAAGGGAALYVSLGTLIFAAFFSNFAHLRELPKKYRLFLMMLPFLAAVFLFSYMPLYGWSYAFYNYKFGLPMSQQEWVGFKWFTELFINAGHFNNMVRVMKNTFAMSGLGILTSWLPMLFAILLNEVTKLRFKKLVQVFTTLPNFISWALVFSFAMAMFSMETGVYSKLMLGIGAIDQPVAWLNSTEHIWLKMWGWNTWKGLGWGAIMYLAAIAGIDQELYEAARVDGAGRWKQMRYITLPGLLPTFFVLLLLSISNIINNGMDQYLVFQNSMNKNTIEVLDLYVYNITIASTSSSMYSFGTAIGILKTLFSVTMLFLANFASKKLRGESIV